MLKKRVIARLDIKGPNLVKGINMEGLRVLGNPSEFAKYYYETGADEIFLMDCVASLYNRNSLNDIISFAAKNTFIPITVGGGIRSLDDINRILRAGADKVSINTAGLKNPSFLRDAVYNFGSSTIVAGIELIYHNSKNEFFCYTDNGREFSGVEMNKWINKVQELGVGEILLSSVDRDGTGEGVDFRIFQNLKVELNIPIIYHGGIGSKEHVLNAFDNLTLDGIALASCLHYGYLEKNRSEPSLEEGNINFIKNYKPYNNIKSFEIEELKQLLIQNKINVRA